MATYHLRVKTVSRGKEQSAVAAAAYRSGDRLTDTATGGVRHYPDRADRIRFTGIFAPFGAPAWARDRSALWNAVERIERRRDATLAREIELSLPHELTDRQRVQLVRDFIRENLTRRGLVVDVAIHGPDRGGDARNVHAHLLVCERPIGPGGFAARKDRGLQSKATLYGWRVNWATLCNRYLAVHGHASRVDHRSFRARGITGQKPTVPLGPVATAMQRRGVVTPRVQRVAAINVRNALRQGWQAAKREAGQPAGRRGMGEAFGPARQNRGQEGQPQQRAGTVSSPSLAQPVTAMSARAAAKTEGGAGFRAALGPPAAPMPVSLYRTKQIVSGPSIRDAASPGHRNAGIGPPAGSVAVPEAARELCSRGPSGQGRDLPTVADAARMTGHDDAGDVEPCSYEAEADGIVQRHARQIDGIRQSTMSRDLRDAAIRAVRDAQRAALAAMRERRYWRKQIRITI